MRPPTPTRPAIQIKTPIEGKAAQTLFEIIEKKENYFYGRATPQTGRFHQIREHARDAGFPILGDLPYDGAKSLKLGDGTILNFQEFAYTRMNSLYLSAPTKRRYLMI